MPVFTVRDDTFLIAIMQYKYLNKHQLRKHYQPLFVGQTESVYYKVINKLLEARYINKFVIPSNIKVPSTIVYHLTDRGAKYIVNNIPDGDELVQQYYRKMGKNSINPTQYFHRWRMVDFLLALDNVFEKETRLNNKFVHTDMTKEKREGFTYKVSRTKLVHSTEPTMHLIPDIAFCLQSNTNNAEALYFVEIDNGTEVIQAGRRRIGRAETIENKYEKYLKIYDDNSFTNHLDTNDDSFVVLTVTNKESRIKRIQEKLHHMTQPNEENPIAIDDMFLFTTHEAVQKNDLLHGDIWQTIDPKSPKFSLAEKLGLK